MAEVDNQMTLEDFAADIKSKLNIPSVRFVGESNQKIKRIAIIGGSVLDMNIKLSNKAQMSLLQVILNIMMP